MISATELKELAATKGEPVVTTVYVDVDGARYPRDADLRTAFGHVLDGARKQADALDDARATAARADVERIASWLTPGFDRSSTRGLAFFVCGTTGLFRVVPLPRAVASSASFGPSPRLRPLVDVLDEYEPTVVALVDHERVRILQFALGELTGASEAFDEATYTPPAGIRTPEEFHRSQEDERRHYAHAADAVAQVLAASDAGRVLVGGPDDAVAGLLDALPTGVRAKVGARLPASLADKTAANEAIHAAALKAAAEAERAGEAALAARLLESRLTARGIDDTLQALNERRVHRLVVDRAFGAPGRRCAGCDSLYAGPAGGCPRCGGRADPVDDVVDEAVKAAIVQGAGVDQVRGGVLDAADHIGALLRY